MLTDPRTTKMYIARKNIASHLIELAVVLKSTMMQFHCQILNAGKGSK